MSTLSGSLEEFNVQPGRYADRPQIWVTTRLGQTQALVIHTPQSDDGDHDKRSSIQMTSSREKSSSESGSSDGSEIESSTHPQTSLSPPDGLTSRWCVIRMRDIYDIQVTMQGMQPRSIYEEPWVTKLNSVLGIEDTIKRYGLQWLTKSLRMYSPIVVREFYASFATTIQSILSKGKKPLAQPRPMETRLRSQ